MVQGIICIHLYTQTARESVLPSYRFSLLYSAVNKIVEISQAMVRDRCLHYVHPGEMGWGGRRRGGRGGGEMLREARRVESRQTTTRSSDGLLPLNCRQRADGEARTDAAVHGSPCIAPTSGERQGAMTSQTNPTLFIIQSFNE